MNRYESRSSKTTESSFQYEQNLNVLPRVITLHDNSLWSVNRRKKKTNDLHLKVRWCFLTTCEYSERERSTSHKV